MDNCYVCASKEAAEALRASTDEMVATAGGVTQEPGRHVAEVREMADRAQFALIFPDNCLQWLTPEIRSALVTLDNSDFYYPPFP